MLEMKPFSEFDRIIASGLHFTSNVLHYPEVS